MDLEAYLMSKQDLGVSSEKLKDLAKQATIEYVRSGTPLNTTIGKMVKEAGLSLEHTKRVVEHANTATFHALFKKGYDKNVSFPVADANVISEECSPTPLTKMASIAIPERTDGYIPGQETFSMGAHFGIPGKEKTAGLESRSILDEKAAAMHSTIKRQVSDLEGLHFEWGVKLATLGSMVKQAKDEGWSAFIVGAAIEDADPSTPGLLDALREEFGDDVAYGERVKIANAGFAMNPGNPVTGLTQDLDLIAQKMMMASSALERTRMGMAELLQILQGPLPMQPTAEVFQPNPMAPQAPMAPPGAGAPMPPQGAAMPPQGPQGA